MELLNNFGVEPVLLGAQIINFLIIFYILKRFMLKPVLEMLRNREQTIKKGLAQAEEARVLLEEASEKERTILKKAQSEAKDMLNDAKKESSDIIAKAEERTRQQTEKMIAEAKTQIADETREAEKRLTQHISRLAIEYLQKSAEQLFTDKEQTAVMGRAVKSLKQKVD